LPATKRKSIQEEFMNDIADRKKTTPKTKPRILSKLARRGFDGMSEDRSSTLTIALWI